MSQTFDVGAVQSKIGRETREKIYLRFLTSPGITRTEIATELGLTRPTVSRHVTAIRRGWSPSWATSMRNHLQELVSVAPAR